MHRVLTVHYSAAGYCCHAFALLLLTLCPTLVYATQVTTNVVAFSGDPAPDGEGTLYLPSSSRLPPTINHAGEVAFLGIQSNRKGGILRSGDAGNLLQIGRRDDVVPDGTSSFRLFSNPALNDSGQVVFRSQLDGPNQESNFENGIFRGDGVSELVQIARTGDLAPDGDGTFDYFFPTDGLAPRLNAAGQVAFFGSLSGTSSSFGFGSGVFLGDGHKILQIVREGDAAPDSNGSFARFADSLQREFALNDAGQVAFNATLNDSSGGNSDGSGIFLGDGATFLQIARAGEPAPDGNGIFGTFIRSRRSGPMQIDINNAGQVIFFAHVFDTVDNRAVFRGLFLGDGTSTSQVARAGDPLAANGEVFGDFLIGRFATLNEAGQVAFLAPIVNTDENTVVSGIFRGDGQTQPIEIVRSGDAAPDDNGSFVRLDHPLAQNNLGQIAFYAELRDTLGGRDDDEGIFLHDDSLGLIQVARKGDDLLGSTLTELQFLNEASNANFNSYNALNDRGQLVYRFGLADGRSGIAIATVVPEPTSVALSALSLLTIASLRRRH